MNEYKAKISYLRIAPRKVRLVADLVRKSKSIDDAIYNLKYSTKRASTPILKLLDSAIANAKQQDSSLVEDKMFIKEIRVDESVKLKRFRAGSRGNVKPIDKKTSNVFIVLSTKDTTPSKEIQTEEVKKENNNTIDTKEEKEEINNISKNVEKNKDLNNNKSKN